MMKNTLKEKKAILDVIESIANNMEWVLQDKADTIKAFERDKEEEDRMASDEGREPSYNTWDQRNAENAAAFLKAWKTVENHLEKLI